jgi:hypothetical protein
VAPVRRTSSSKDVLNTADGWPAAAQTTSWRCNHTSMQVRIGAGCPIGETPPIT